tara:strand:+ start:16930 stop:17784 length:855 start_codon:yes stop_codon:yes gene_type:complete
MFDNNALNLHRQRATENYGSHSFLMQEIAKRLSQRIDDISRKFPKTLCFCWQEEILYKAINSHSSLGKIFSCSRSPTLKKINAVQFAADTELVPLAPHSIDLAISLLGWHWINDLPGTFSQIRSALNPDGLLLGAMLGGETLRELKSVFVEAETEMEAGISPRVSSFVDVETLGSLLQRAGFALPVVDVDTITVTYTDMFKLMLDIRGMGEGNCMNERRKSFTRRTTLFRANELYRKYFSSDSERIYATFQILYFTAWTPHRSQPQPSRPGTGRYPLEKALTGE